MIKSLLLRIVVFPVVLFSRYDSSVFQDEEELVDIESVEDNAMKITTPQLKAKCTKEVERPFIPSFKYGYAVISVSMVVICGVFGSMLPLALGLA